MVKETKTKKKKQGGKKMKKMSRLLLILGTLGLVVSLFAGCGNSTKKTGAGGSKNEITFWNPFTGPDGKNMQAMIDAYNKTNPEYKIKNVSLKETDMYTKIPTVVNSKKNIPDVTIVHAERLKQYKDNHMLTAYDDYLSDYPKMTGENYVTEAWNIGNIENKRYSIPLDIHTFGLYYNKDLVEKYLPNALDDQIVTFDEIKEVGEKAQKENIASLGVSWVKPNYLSLYAQNGGELSKDGTTPTLDNAAGKKTYKLWNNYVKEGYTTKDGEDATQLFLTGKVVFLPEGIWMQNQIKQSKINWGLTNAPQLSADLSQAVNWSSSHQFVLFNSKERNKAKTKGVIDFIDWVRDHSMEWAKSGQNPASLSILENEEYKKMPQAIFLLDPEEQKTLKIFDYKYNGYVSEYLEAHGVDTIFGTESIDDSLVNMQKEVTDKIAKDKTNNE